ncbi:MAG: two-component regulator propeller domain-containing protein [Bacteroidota bacterium]
MKRFNTTLLFFEIILLNILLYSCIPKESVPFPENASGYKVPITKSFEYPETKPIVWQKVSKDSVPQEKVYPLDMEKLPWKRFTVNTFKPEKEPVQSIPLNWDTMDEITFNLDTVKTEIFRIKSFLLPKPEITKASPPSQFPGSTSGILQMGIDEGLPGNYIYETAIDKNGIIWMSTERGLTRYNGDFFEAFDFLPNLANGNPDFITDILVDKENNLWMITQGGGLFKLNSNLGLVQYLELEDEFARIALDADGKLWCTANEYGLGIINMGKQIIQRFVFPELRERDNLFIGIKTDSESNIWIGNREEIYVINSGQTGYIILNDKNGLELSYVFDFYETKSGEIWINSLKNGSYSVSADKKSIQVVNEKQGFSGRALAIAEDTAGKIWLIDNDTIFIHDPVKHYYKKVPTGVVILLSGNSPNALIDPFGMLWLGTPQNKMLIIDPLGGLPEHLDINDGLVSNNVWGIIEDRDGLIWLGTYNGINIYDPALKKLMLITTENGISDNRRSNLIVMNDGRILAGGAQGFTIIDKENKSLTEYNTELFTWSCLDRKDENIWFGGSDGVYVFNLKSKTMKKLTKYMNTPLFQVWALLEDKNGRIWVCTISGIYMIDPEYNTISLFSEETGLIHDSYYAMHKTESGELWTGGDSGFSIINTDKNTVTLISSEQGLYPETLWDFAELNGRMYIGSQDGIVMLQPPKPSDDSQMWNFYNYGKSNGYPFNDYNQMASTTTRDGQIWWGVVPQITVITQEPIVNTKKPGVFISGISIMDQESDFTGSDYQKKVFTQVDTLWNIDMTKFNVFNTLSEDSGYYANNNIKWDSISPLFHLPIGLKLPFDQNSISFSFTNPEIKGRDKIVYRYILEGIDQKWSRITDQTVSRNYYNLKHGKYTFKVATRGFNGKWSEPAQYEFTILPPWWFTPPAYLMYLIILAVIVYIIDRIQRRRIINRERERAREKELEQAREIQKAYTDLKSTQSQLIQSEKMASLGELTAGIAHEIQNPLNFVNNFSEVNTELSDEIAEEAEKGNLDEIKIIAKDIKDNSEKINHHGKRADAIVKGMLQHSRTNNGQKEPTDINALADEYLRLSYHGLRAKDKSFNADFKTEFDETLPKINVIPQDIGRVLLNLINNAFYAVQVETQNSASLQQTPQKQPDYKPVVMVSTKNMRTHVEICVKDNGPGIPPEIKDKIFQPFFTTKPTGHGTGLGLSLSYDIVKAHGGELRVETKQGKGSIFIITIPSG